MSEQAVLCSACLFACAFAEDCRVNVQLDANQPHRPHTAVSTVATQACEQICSIQPIKSLPQQTLPLSRVCWGELGQHKPHKYDPSHLASHLSTACVALQPKMVYELTAVVLNQIVSGRKSVLEAYAEIVFKAWRGATGACLERIETHLIQNVGELRREETWCSLRGSCQAMHKVHGVVCVCKKPVMV